MGDGPEVMLIPFLGERLAKLEIGSAPIPTVGCPSDVSLVSSDIAATVASAMSRR